MFAFGPVLYIFHNADKWAFLLSYVAQYYVTDHGQIGIPALANFQQKWSQLTRLSSVHNMFLVNIDPPKCACHYVRLQNSCGMPMPYICESLLTLSC